MPSKGLLLFKVQHYFVINKYSQGIHQYDQLLLQLIFRDFTVGPLVKVVHTLGNFEYDYEVPYIPISYTGES
jgi:hypothetical protein